MSRARPQADQALAVPVEPASGLAPSGFDPSRMAAYWIKDAVYVLPRLESRPRWVGRLGRSLAVGVGFRWTSFGVGVDVLKAGLMVMIGPMFVWIAHVERQLAAFDAIATEARRAETTSGSVHEGAGRQASPK